MPPGFVPNYHDCYRKVLVLRMLSAFALRRDRYRLPAGKDGIVREMPIAKPQIAQPLGGGFDSSASFDIYE